MTSGGEIHGKKAGAGNQWAVTQHRGKVPGLVKEVGCMREGSGAASEGGRMLPRWGGSPQKTTTHHPLPV